MIFAYARCALPMPRAALITLITPRCCCRAECLIAARDAATPLRRMICRHDFSWCRSAAQPDAYAYAADMLTLWWHDYCRWFWCWCDWCLLDAMLMMLLPRCDADTLMMRRRCWLRHYYYALSDAITIFSAAVITFCFSATLPLFWCFSLIFFFFIFTPLAATMLLILFIFR